MRPKIEYPITCLELKRSDEFFLPACIASQDGKRKIIKQFSNPKSVPD